jgi:YegS/Rv2252/BmrU family lipid kinase
MLAKKKIRFIINPISGGRTKKDIPTLIDKYLSKEKYTYELAYTKTAAHAQELCLEAIEKGFDMVVAAGGDGTLNLVASALVQTDIPLGIIPLGSGNGFARAMNIPLNTIDAISLLNDGVNKQIDTGSANGISFINVCGFGFDAHVSSKFAEAGTRGLKTYAKISLNELKAYQNQTYELHFNESERTEKAFIMAVCNGPQYGNNAHIAPSAKFDDGLFDITILKDVNWLNAIGITTNLFLGNLKKSKQVDSLVCQDIEITQPTPNWVNIDGEPIWMEKAVSIRMKPQSLKVIVPTNE